MGATARLKSTPVMVDDLLADGSQWRGYLHELLPLEDVSPEHEVRSSPQQTIPRPLCSQLPDGPARDT